MKWSEGHNWRVEIPYSKIITESQKNFGNQTIEFKFVVKFSESGSSNFKVIRWEGGSKNHIFDGQHIKNILQDSKV